MKKKYATEADRRAARSRQNIASRIRTEADRREGLRLAAVKAERNREYYASEKARLRLARWRASISQPSPTSVHQVIRTLPPPVPGFMAYQMAWNTRT